MGQSRDYENAKGGPCPIVDAIDTFGSRWKGAIIWLLHDGPKRFGALKKSIPEISAKVLTQQLRQLEQDGLILREQFPEIPPKVVYELTELGRSVLPLLDSIAHWWRDQAKAIEKAQQRGADSKLH